MLFTMTQGGVATNLAMLCAFYFANEKLSDHISSPAMTLESHY